MKKGILEYFTGDPDIICDVENGIKISWNTDSSTCFGFFPVDLNGGYDFLVGDYNHFTLAGMAAKIIVGKALGHVKKTYIDNWITPKCYDMAYGLGRYWKDYKIIVFWSDPSSYFLSDIIKRLGIDGDKYYIVSDDVEENIKVSEYIGLGLTGESSTGVVKKPFPIDKNVAETIKSYNSPNETWQSRKEKDGWGTIAKRNATLYQEGKERINEYFTGDPDTIYEVDDNTKGILNGWSCSDSEGISFGWFQTTLDGGKEFVAMENITHSVITKGLSLKLIGGAEVKEDDKRYLWYSLYSNGAYLGRTFSEPRVITTWYKVSSEKLAEILDNIGGVEAFSDYTYVYDNGDGKIMGSHNVIDYINSNDGYVDPHNEKNMNMKMQEMPIFPKSAADIIRANNANKSVLSRKTEKLGDMTIAQYNSLIRQEGKETKNTIKETAMAKNGHQEEFSNYIGLMEEALKNNNFNAYNAAKRMLDESIEKRKEDERLMNEMNTTNFGILNHVFEQQLPKLLKTNKKAVKDVIRTIKEDKNLLGEFNFYNVVKNEYKGKSANIEESSKVLNTIVDIVLNDIDQDTVRKSNRKLMKVMKENNVFPSELVDEESRNLYESGNVILTKKRTSSNMIPLIESYDSVCKYMERHKGDTKTEGKDIDELMESFENKLKSTLNESEMSFVKEITDFRSPIASKRKKGLFEKIKNECIGKIAEMMTENEGNDGLKELDNKLREMRFNDDTIITDIAKLLEIRDILLDS